jgi:hypothetical protein
MLTVKINFQSLHEMKKCNMKYDCPQQTEVYIDESKDNEVLE